MGISSGLLPLATTTSVQPGLTLTPEMFMTSVLNVFTFMTPFVKKKIIHLRCGVPLVFHCDAVLGIQLHGGDSNLH